MKNFYDFNDTDISFVDSCENSLPRVTLAVAEICIAVIGIAFNGVAIFIIMMLKDYKKNTSHWYVLQLAGADVLFLAFLPLIAHQHLTGTWHFPAWMCQLFQGVFMLSYFAGMLFLTIMSFDRYLAIVHPISAFWRELRTKRNANIATAIIWLVAIILSIPLWVWSGVNCVCGFHVPPLSLGSDENYEDNTSFYEVYAMGHLLQDNLEDLPVHASCQNPPWYSFNVWLVINFVLTFVIPTAFITVCYSLILKRVLYPPIKSETSSSGRFKLTSTSSETKRNSTSSSVRKNRNSTISNRPFKLKQQRKVTMIVVILVVVFLLCWTPFHFVHLSKIKGMYLSDEACAYLVEIVTLFAYSNCMLNPILYTFMGSKFYQRWNSSIARFRRRRRNSSRMFSRSSRSLQSGAQGQNRTVTTFAPTQTSDHCSSSIPLNPIRSSFPSCAPQSFVENSNMATDDQNQLIETP